LSQQCLSFFLGWVCVWYPSARNSPVCSVKQSPDWSHVCVVYFRQSILCRSIQA
jgi:hypothetical protein